MRTHCESYPIIIDITPTDIDADPDKLETKIREIKFDGIEWGKSQRIEKYSFLSMLQFKVIIANDEVNLDDFLALLEEDDEISSAKVEAGGIKLI